MHRTEEDESDEQDCKYHPTDQHIGAHWREFVIVALEIKEDDDGWHDITHIATDLIREFQPVAAVGLVDEIRPAPAITTGAEKYKGKTAQWQQVVGNDEVFQIKNSCPFTQWLEISPFRIAKHTWQAQDGDENAIDQDALSTAPAKLFTRERCDVLHNSGDRGHGRKAQEKEEQSAPELPAWHLRKEVWNGHKDQVWTTVWLQTESKASWDDDEPTHDPRKRTEQGDGHSFTRKTALFLDVTPKDQHRADTQGKREERLTHRCKKNVADADLL